MKPALPSRRRALRLLGSIALPAAAWPAHAAEGGLPNATHDASSPEWERLSAQLFPGKRLVAGHDVVQVIVPLRAAYGASVPVKVVSKLAPAAPLQVRRIYLVVDKNPSPVAMVEPSTSSSDVATLRSGMVPAASSVRRWSARRAR